MVKLIEEYSDFSKDKYNEIKSFKIFQWNIMAENFNKYKIISQEERYNKIIEILKEQEYDFIILFEVDLVMENLLKNNFKDNFIYSSLNSNIPYSQVIISKYSADFSIFSFGKKSHKKVIFLKFYFQNITLHFTISHLQSGLNEFKQRQSQVNAIEKYLKELSNCGKIWIGDFNFDLKLENEKKEAKLTFDWIDLINNKYTFVKNNIYNILEQIDQRYDRLYFKDFSFKYENEICDTKLSDHCYLKYNIQII